MIKTHIISKVGAKPAVSLTPDDLNRIMTNMISAGKSKTTTRYVFRIVHRIMEDAVRKGKLARNIADLADPPPAIKAEGKAWDETEFDLLYE